MVYQPIKKKKKEGEQIKRDRQTDRQRVTERETEREKKQSMKMTEQTIWFTQVTGKSENTDLQKKDGTLKTQ